MCGVVSRKGVHTDTVVLIVTLESIETAAVLPELPGFVRRQRRVVAVQQERFVLIDPDVEASGRLSVKPFHRGIPIHRVKFLRLNVTKQAALRTFVGVVSHRQQRLAGDFTFQEQRSPAGATRRPKICGVPEFLFKSIIASRRHQILRIQFAQIEPAFKYAHENQWPQVRHKRELLVTVKET